MGHGQGVEAASRIVNGGAGKAGLLLPDKIGTFNVMRRSAKRGRMRTLREEERRLTDYP